MFLLRIAHTLLALAAAAGLALGVYVHHDAPLGDLQGQRAALAAPGLRVMTYNVRVETPSDGDNNWPHRRAAVATLIRHHQPDILALQECYISSVHELAAELPGYSWYGRGSGEAESEGAANPIFFRTSRMELVRTRTIWLSDTPDVYSVGWDAAYPRVATMVVLRDRQSGIAWNICNVHLDHRGQLARRQSADVLLQQFAARRNAIVLGDFNSLAQGDAVSGMTRGGAFVEARVTSLTGHTGLEVTYNGFRRLWPRPRKIDHILVSPDVIVNRHEVPGDTVQGRIPSDHFPVIADVAPAAGAR